MFAGFGTGQRASKIKNLLHGLLGAVGKTAHFGRMAVAVQREKAVALGKGSGAGEIVCAMAFGSAKVGFDAEVVGADPVGDI